MRIRQHRLRRLYDESKGATTIEYGLILALIVTMMLAGLVLLSGNNGNLWGNLSIKVSNAML